MGNRMIGTKLDEQTCLPVDIIQAEGGSDQNQSGGKGGE